MEKNEMLEELVTRRPITDEAETSIIDGDCVISYNNHASTSATITVIFSTIVAISGSYAFGNAVRIVGYSSPAKSGIMEDLGLSLSEYAVFGSILTVGGMLGAACSGKIADLVGRRGVSLLLTVTYVKDAWYPVSCLMQAMGISEIFCITGWFAIVFSKDALWLDLGRLLVGCGSGVLCYVIPLYVAEIAAKNVRGAFSSLTILMLCCGKAVMFIMGSLINWRTSALIGVIPCVLQLIGLLFIPESPRWLATVFETIWHENSLMCPIDTANQLQAKTNETKEFEAVLRRLRGEHADISQETTDIRLYTEYIEQIPDERLLNLSQKRYAYPLIVGAGLMMFREFGGLNGFSYYTSFIFESAGFPSTVGSIGVAVLQIFMAIIGILFIDKSGRRPLLLVFFLSFELGMGGIPWIIVSEIFPLNIRGSGGSMVNLINWTSSWVVSYTYPFLFEWNSAGTFFIFAFMGAVATVFIGKLVPETNGRTLEELQTY
ncbi:sugar transporter ERD6-like 5 [Gossypium australe]|uniref:Sugar transporter ERD6-like 5 n=1 Tax=Gossypium australe TaxID=47621 RepID=A0A5B6VUQ5_9ROSI|nr:sugar transporter ERD6-like 5 [Gossypium australe]